MRGKILRELKQQGHVSGESLGRKLNISRSAVWKHIKELRKKGYQISSSPRTGYSFIKGTDLIVPEEISMGLATRFMGKRIIYRDEVTSTQDLADKFARGGAEEGTVVIAELQTSGRGRKRRSWVSPARGGIYFSIILRPNLKPLNVIQIPLVAGVALAKAIEQITHLQPRIKWPNDINLGDKKVAGILTEMNCEVDRVNHIILGIGINVNTKAKSMPGTLRDIATSVAEECGEKVSRAELITQLLSEFETLYYDFLSNGFEVVGRQWKMLTNTLGSRIKIIDDQEEIFGKALDIDENGFLIIETDSGEIKKITGGDVSLRKL